MLPYSNPIWKQISDNFEGKITGQTLYINIYQDRHSWQTILKEILGFTKLQYTSDIDEEEIINRSPQNLDEDHNSDYDGNLKSFKFEVPYQKFLNMKPVEMSYGKTKRKFTVLKPGIWTIIINETFSNNYKVPCAFVYKHCRVNRVVEHSKHYLQFEGKCRLSVKTS